MITLCSGHLPFKWLNVQKKGLASWSASLVARRVTLVVAIRFLLPNFGKVVRTFEWYFVILWIQVEWWGHSNIAVIKFIWTFCTQNQWGCWNIFLVPSDLFTGQATWWSLHYLIFSLGAGESCLSSRTERAIISVPTPKHQVPWRYDDGWNMI